MDTIYSRRRETFPSEDRSVFLALLADYQLTRAGVKFPSTFINTAKTILRRLFRVYAHIYHQHFDQICALGIEGMSSFLIRCTVVREDN